MDAIQGKIKTASKTRDIASMCGNLAPQMQNAMKSLDINKIDLSMKNFEKTLENLDIATS
jgi:hypothetical protein